MKIFVKFIFLLCLTTTAVFSFVSVSSAEELASEEMQYSQNAKQYFATADYYKSLMEYTKALKIEKHPIIIQEEEKLNLNSAITKAQWMILPVLLM